MSGRILSRGGGGSFQERGSEGTYGSKVERKEGELTILNQHDASSPHTPASVGVGSGEDEQSSGSLEVPAAAQSAVDEARSGS